MGCRGVFVREDLKRSVELASAVAALKTTRIGARAGLQWIDELEEFLRHGQK